MLSPALASEIHGPSELARLPLIPDPRWRGWFAQFQTPVTPLHFTADYSSQDWRRVPRSPGPAPRSSRRLFARLLAEGKLVRPFRNIVTEANSYFVAVAETERRTAASRCAIS